MRYKAKFGAEVRISRKQYIKKLLYYNELNTLIVHYKDHLVNVYREIKTVLKILPKSKLCGKNLVFHVTNS